MKTATELARELIPQNQEMLFAVTSSENVVGIKRKDRDGHYVASIALTLTGEWVGLPYEILANGKPMVSKWIPVSI